MKKIIMLVVLSTILASSVLMAEAKYSIKTMTPEVQSALDNRRDRFDQLHQLKSTGAIGESNRGYVDVLKDEGDAKAVATAENQDRRTIYQTIAQQNGLESALSTIETVFAGVQRDKASSGDKIQDEDGNWGSK